MAERKSIPIDRKLYQCGGYDVLVHRAIIAIPCFLCCQDILPGDLFMRSASKDGKALGIRYAFCRQCMPFEEKSADSASRELHIAKSVMQEQMLSSKGEERFTWKDLKGYELVQICLDEEGEAFVTDQMGVPLLRGSVAWIIRVAQRYLELYTDEEIEALWQERIEIMRDTDILPLPKSKNMVSGYVYLISGGGYHKIGKTVSLQNRFNQISPKLPFVATIAHAIKTTDINALEAYWHNHFTDKRVHGEWFTLSPEDIDEFTAQEEMEVPT